MKRTRWTSDSPHNALQIALASAGILSLAAAPAVAVGDISAPAPAQSGVYVAILSPNPGSSLTSSGKIEISAYYESAYGVSSVDLFIDGRRMATQRLTSPEGRGEISFLVDPAALRTGSHTIVVRATATDAEVASARTTLDLPSSTAGQGQATPGSNLAGGSASAADSVGPTITVLDPKPNSTVQGIVRIKVDATDPSGKAPYVSLFVDHSFKTLRNFAPYSFDWDTTRLPNGYHTIEILGYNDSQQVGQAAPIRVFVNNPGGRTFERHDLSDTPGDLHPARAEMHSAATTTSRAALRTKAAPIMASAVSRSIADIIGRADKLASLPQGTAELGDVDLIEGSTAPALSGEAGLSSSPSLHVTVKAVVRRDIAITSTDSSGRTVHGGPLFAAPRPGIAATEAHGLGPVETGRADEIAALGEPEVQTEYAAPHLRLPAAAMRRLMKAATQAEIGRDNTGHLRADESREKSVMMASAGLSDNDAVLGERHVAIPHLDISRIEARSEAEMPAIVAGKVSINRISEADVHNLRGEYQVVVDDRRVELDRPLSERGAILFAPMRQIIQSQGGELNWDQATRQVRATTTHREIVVTIGSKKAIINDRTVRLSSAPYLYNNRTMLPLDFFGAAMNAKVSYDAETGHVIIESR